MRLNQITVDNDAGKTGNQVLYIGTEDARILRLRPRLLPKQVGCVFLTLSFVRDDVCKRHFAAGFPSELLQYSKLKREKRLAKPSNL